MLLYMKSSAIDGRAYAGKWALFIYAGMQQGVGAVAGRAGCFAYINAVEWLGQGAGRWLVGRGVLLI